MSAPVPGRDEAIRLLRADRLRTRALLERLPRRALTTLGLGGGGWSPKDLIGHLESWEQHALDALDAWSLGRVAPSDHALRIVGLDAFNLAEVTRKERWSVARSVDSAAATHRRLLAALGSISADAWSTPPTERETGSLGTHLGGILGGPAGPFRHDVAHHPDLEALAAVHTRQRHASSSRY
jgi:DinB superfamily